MNELDDNSDYITAALSLLYANSTGASCAALARDHDMPAYKVRHLVRIGRKLHPDTVKLCRRNQQLTFGHARVLASIDVPRQIDAARTIIARRWSVRQLERYARGEQHSADDSYYEHLSDALSEQMGRPLVVVPDKSSPTAGTISVRYFGADDFETVCSQMGLSFEE